MDRDLGRRAFFSGLVGLGTAGLSFSAANGPLGQFAPLSGSVWESAHADRHETVDSPYGPATVRYDETGVPHLSADDEQALYFAVGYTQATDRLFQMDLQRRLYRGELSAIVGSTALDTDRFHRQMAFADAAEVTAESLDGTPVAPILDAYAEGVNAAMENETLSLGFKLLGYEPDEWTRTDTALIEKIIAWQLTGSFQTLTVSLVRERLEGLFSEDQSAALTAELFPSRFDDVSPILRDHHDVGEFTVGDDATSSQSVENRNSAPDKALVDWVNQFEPPESFGSNSWIIGPELADGDAPILSNDPHLGLQAPPTWYEMHIDGPDHRARGATFPGAPVVVIGENNDGAWGFTNANADVIDFYTYDHDGDTYQYGDERREFESRTEEIVVDGGPNETVEIRKTVHGPVIEEEKQEVGVAWTGHTATETMLSLYDLSHSSGIDDAVAAAERFESPTQNMVYADRDGNTLYYMTGRVPIRRIDGEMVSGDQIFDGSAQEGEWDGFVPFGESSWEGFVPQSANPKVRNPRYLATANQQIVPDDQLDYYLSAGYASPYRGRRIYDLLDQRVADGEPIDIEFLKRVARDTFDGRAERLVEPLVEAARDGGEELQTTADLLDSWDYHLDADSRAALVWELWFDNYREELFDETFDDADLDSSYYPQDGALVQLGEGSAWFGSRGREAVMRTALEQTVSDLAEIDAEVYGDVNHTGHISHLTELGFLGYPSYPRGGSDQTVWNYDRNGPWGGSWEMHADFDGDLLGILPGGNSGRYFSDHYDDQIERWANGEYRTLSREIEGDVAVEFVEGDE
ncbi:penicillin amidase [Halovenus aranensis]|uniref:Penicillin amidase n=1 Tax=Halovenus aranensis TaxID=890420 RepID=A0A1G8TEY6_9EURY|nr:penicillin acylase family protein [Halovenus aranensis]SDJ39964.1 penicillin amidase [Halovenus aranensis]